MNQCINALENFSQTITITLLPIVRILYKNDFDLPSQKSPVENKDQSVCGGNLNAILHPCKVLPVIQKRDYAARHLLNIVYLNNKNY